MRIVLFYPRGRPFDPASHDVGHLAASLPPLGLASIAAVLRKAGHQVSIIDAALSPQISNDIWVNQIISKKPDWLGFSAITPAFLDAYDICRRVKEKLADVKTVFGGVHVSWGKDIILNKFDAIDYVIAGEGETAFLKLVTGDNPSTIPGVYSRNGSSINAGPLQARENLISMDDLPFPALDLVDGFPLRYNLPLFGYRKHPGAHIISSRGCVYQCSYCDRSVFGKTFRWNSPEYTFEQVNWLYRDFGVRHIYFYDDLFTLNPDRVAKLCGLLRESRLGIQFNCIVRIGHIDKDLISTLKSAGCWMVNVGIESGDQRILDENKEGVTLEAIKNDVQALHQSGVYVKGLFMMGFPGETEESIKKTIELACSLPLKDANITAFTPYPGAPITRDINSFGTFEDDWNKMDCTTFVFVPKEIGSKVILEQYYKEFISRFYNRPFARKVYRKMMFESPHSYWRLIRNLPAFLSYQSWVKK